MSRRCLEQFCLCRILAHAILICEALRTLVAIRLDGFQSISLSIYSIQDL